MPMRHTKIKMATLTLTQPLRQLVTISYLTLTASMVMTALKTITFYR